MVEVKQTSDQCEPDLTGLLQQEADECQQEDAHQDGHHHNPQGGAGVQLLAQVWIDEDLNLQRQV
ncbi:hypothetical protein INR49_009485 [Caranx melampygus]|nr:hypothetical protein INR49_009485 [Caranx melampygus]